MRDIENGTIEVARRDTLEKKSFDLSDIGNKIEHMLENIQENLYNKAVDFREENTHIVDSYDEFKKVLEEKGGFIYAHWDGTAETEEKIQQETKATIRCIPFGKPEAGKCMVSGNPSARRVVFAKAY